MTTAATTTRRTTRTASTPISSLLRTETKRWSWLRLIAGAVWILVSVMILQFDQSSAATVGTIAGVMFLGAGVEYFFLGSAMRSVRWLWYSFGALLTVGGYVALLYPTRTFVVIASILLSYMFAVIGSMWVVEAFLARDDNDLWWLRLGAGILMVVQGLWLSGQFLITQAAALLIFAGVWAMMRGILDITFFFTMRNIADAIPAE